MAKPVTNEYTLSSFMADYPNDDACLEKIFDMTYGEMKSCPKCGFGKRYVRVKGRRSYQCNRCYNQIYPTANTIFDKTRVPLTSWFYGIFMFTVSKNGFAAHELARAVGVSIKTALRMLKRIRMYLQNDESTITDTVQLDEAFVGGKNKNRHHDKKVKNSQGRSFKDKTPVVGMYEVNTGRIIAKVVPNVQARVLHPLLLTYIEKGSTLLTDEYTGYEGLDKYYIKESCNHSKKQYIDGQATTNAVENFWSIMKRTINGSYIRVTRKYLHLYVKEVVFRFNNRNSTNIFREYYTLLFIRLGFRSKKFL